MAIVRPNIKFINSSMTNCFFLRITANLYSATTQFNAKKGIPCMQKKCCSFQLDFFADLCGCLWFLLFLRVFFIVAALFLSKICIPSWLRKASCNKNVPQCWMLFVPYFPNWSLNHLYIENDFIWVFGHGPKR